MAEVHADYFVLTALRQPDCPVRQKRELLHAAADAEETPIEEPHWICYNRISRKGVMFL